MARKGLLIGTDDLLLETRARVLRQVHVSTVCASEFSFTDATFRAEGFDVVLLCHSLQPMYRETLAATVHAASPATPVFLLHWQSNVLVKPSNIDGVLSPDPSELVSVLENYFERPHAVLPQTSAA